MPTPLHTPRVNNNDDVVKVLRILVRPGDRVAQGDTVAEVETDKANFTVEAESSGVVLAVLPKVSDVIAVGSVLMWLGVSEGEAIPLEPPNTASAETDGGPTIKAAQLLARYGLRPADIPGTKGRLTAADVEAFVTRHGVAAGNGSPGAKSTLAPHVPAGRREALSPNERTMLRTVLWQRQEAVPAYVELQFDPAAWQQTAADYQREHGLVLSPLLAMMAYRLVTIARDNPRVNATIIGDERHVYDAVNLGFTIQTDSTLYLVVVENAGALDVVGLVERLGQLQRAALTHRLKETESSGATIAFSSMARWNASRHVPVLPPQTAMIVAHAAARHGIATLGATYDHRVLTGGEALAVLSQVADPRLP